MRHPSEASKIEQAAGGTVPPRRLRRTLILLTLQAGGIAAGASLWPFLASMMPSERAKAAAAPVDVDIGNIAPGEMKTVEWRRQPIWILRRTKEMLATLPLLDARLADPHSQRSIQPAYARNETRSIRPEHLVVVGICTHLGCSPIAKFEPGATGMGAGWLGGFFCPCHGSRFDLAGRVFANMPAPTNLVVPPYRYHSETRILIGDKA